MELKKYQQTCINDLQDYFDELKKVNNLKQSYYNYWLSRDIDLNEIENDDYLHSYDNTVAGVPRVMFKVPTAGGKTFLACNAIKTIFDNLPDNKLKVVAWFVPSDTILKQTFDNLNNPNHPYRQKINVLFGGKVEVVNKELALQGQHIQPNELGDQLTIFVLSVQSFASNNKEGRKSYKENSNLAEYANFFANKEKLADADETSLIHALAYLNPVVIIDESHNFGTKLRIELFQQINPRFILDLTATPREKSNIISFVDSMKLKEENMVKLPVIVYSKDNEAEVIRDSIALRNTLEAKAIDARKKGGKYIRPIILFQAQPKSDDDNVTYDKIKEKLINEFEINSDEIKIKTADKNELKGIDLMSEDCPVRYIITVNALKEGWDCPFAYILASLANKSSKIDVEQILGRILRNPYQMRHLDSLLNYSYVYTSSQIFDETITKILQGLQASGFSERDYRVANPEPEKETENKGPVQGDLWKQSQQDNSPKKEPSPEQPSEDKPEDKPTEDNEKTEGSSDNQPKTEESEESSSDVQTDKDTNSNNQTQETQTTSEGGGKTFPETNQDVKRAAEEGEKFESGKSNNSNPVDNKKKKYTIRDKFKELVKNLSIPNFYYVVPPNHLTGENGSYEMLTREILAKDFNLVKCDKNVDFSAIEHKIKKIDLQEREKGEYVPKAMSLNEVERKYLDKLYETVSRIPSLDGKKEQLKQAVAKKMKFDVVHEPAISNYIKGVFSGMNDAEVMDRFKDFNNTTIKVSEKINNEIDKYVKKRFFELLQLNKIECKYEWKFKNEITFARKSESPAKNLYTEESEMNGFEKAVIKEVAEMDNIEFWHRNLERGKGFHLNGFLNTYPDFIIYTKKGNYILLETKGDDRDNSDSKNKIELGNKWQEKAGSNYKYFMVFDQQEVDGAYTKNKFLELLKEL